MALFIFTLLYKSVIILLSVSISFIYTIQTTQGQGLVCLVHCVSNTPMNAWHIIMFEKDNEWMDLMVIEQNAHF